MLSRMSLGAAVLLLSVAMLPVLAGGAASAAGPQAVPVAGVAAFGIGGGAGVPAGVAVDVRGDVFEAAGSQVAEYVRGSTRTSYPSPGVTIGGVGTSGLGAPDGVALDRRGDLFVSYPASDLVMEYAYRASRHAYALAGRVVAGTGTAGSGAGQLSGPEGVAVDTAGNLFVADTGNNRVQDFARDPATGRYAADGVTVAGGGLGSGASQLDTPTSVALDSRGDLFVVDLFNWRVMEYAASAGAYPAGGTVAAGDLPALPGWVALNRAGDLFVSYSYLGYGGVLEFSYSPATGSFAGTGTAVADGDMVGPTGLAFDARGDLFAGQTQQSSDPSQTYWDFVLEFTYQPRAGTFAPVGTIMYQQGRVNRGVSAVAVDSHGDLFAADGSVYEFRYRPATASYSVKGTVIAPSGSLLAVDGRNDLFVATAGSPGVLEYRWYAATRRYPDTGSPVPGAVQLPGLDVTALTADARGDLFVASGGQVLEYQYQPSAGSYAGTGTVIAAVTAGGLAVDTHGDLFVSVPATSQVQEIRYDARTDSYAEAGITVAGAAGTAQLNDPTGLAVSPAGDLLVFNAGSNQILDFTGSPATGSYAPAGVALYSGPVDSNPENGGVTADLHGDVLFGNDATSAVVYEIPASTTAPAQ